jgi:hypothetical protein
VSSQNLEQRSKVKFCVQLGEGASEMHTLLSETYGTEALLKSNVC